MEEDGQTQTKSPGLYHVPCVVFRRDRGKVRQAYARRSTGESVKTTAVDSVLWNIEAGNAIPAGAHMRLQIPALGKAKISADSKSNLRRLRHCSQLSELSLSSKM